MTFAPQLFLGQVMHKRLHPVEHKFLYPVFYVHLPLRHLEACACGIFSLNRRNLLSFHNRDHGPRDGSSLITWIENLLTTHQLPHDGEIVLQTFPRVLGYVFNPVSFWYCHNLTGQLIAVVAEVNNTFGASHSYLLHHQGEPLQDGETFDAAKCFHVSPFNQVEGSYQFRFRYQTNRQTNSQTHRQTNHQTQFAQINYTDSAGLQLLTTIYGQPHAWSTRALALAFLRMPFLTLGVMLRIHWQAFKLWRKGVTFYGKNSH